MEMVQRKIFVPIPRFVIVVLGLPEFVIVPEPLTNDHAPDPTTGVLAAIVAELMVTDWLGPALAAVGLRLKVTFTSSVKAVQGELEIVQRST